MDLGLDFRPPDLVHLRRTASFAFNILRVKSFFFSLIKTDESRDILMGLA